MKRLFIKIFILLVSTFLNASSSSGEKIYLKELSKSCKLSCLEFTRLKTKKQWNEIFITNNYKNELLNICSDLKKENIKDIWIKDLYDFSYKYAKDSTLLPPC